MANRLLRRTRDFAEVEGEGAVDVGVVELTLDRLGIDEEGLDAMDRKVLETVAYKFDGGPVGIDSLATAIGEEADTIEDVYEPFLIMRGLLQRTRWGTCALTVHPEYTALLYHWFPHVIPCCIR